MEIPFYYDPMIAKLICHADTRTAAIDKMIRAIDEYEITGLETTLGFCRFVMQHERFRSGDFDTRFVENYFTPNALMTSVDIEEEKIAAAIAVLLMNGNSNGRQNESPPASRWKKSRLK